MKTKKLTAIILAVIMLFSCMVPVYAAGEQTAADKEQTVTLSIVEKIKEVFHNIIERIFNLFGIPCPFCEEGDYVPVYTKDAVAKYNAGVNAVKNYTGAIRVTKTEDMSVEISDVPAVAESVMSEVAESFERTRVYVWNFTGGKNSDGVAITDKVEPCGRDAALDAAGVTVAESVELENGGSRLRIVLAPEESVYDGTAVVVEPVYNAGVITPVNFGALELGPIVVQSAETIYTETELKAEFDGQGRITKLEISSPMDIVATAKAVISVSAAVSVYTVTKYTFTY